MKSIENDSNNVLNDHLIHNDAIRPEFRIKEDKEAFELIDDTEPGDYISLSNKNNLSEVHVYRRTSYDETVPDDCVWDGESFSTDWYNEKDKILLIKNANDLRGLYELIKDGITFENREIRITNNINLNYHEWTPIGSDYFLETHKDKSLGLYSKYNIKIDTRHTFKGILNGCNRIIYGLSMTTPYDQCNFYGMFLTAMNAVFKNIILADVNITSADTKTSYAGLVGVAQNCTFSSIMVSGTIKCTKPSGVCGIARDSVFYNCTNSAELISSTTEVAGIIAGGICQQLTISKERLEELADSVPKVFCNCKNEGSITIDAENAKYVWAGHFFGGTFYESDVVSFSFQMDRCIIDSAKIELTNSDKCYGENILYGYVDHSSGQSNNTGLNCKNDLLYGMIGRVDKHVKVEVTKATKSSIINNMVIPGTMNTLVSGVREKSFQTVSARAIRTEDCIADLEPFFKYIKSVEI